MPLDGVKNIVLVSRDSLPRCLSITAGTIFNPLFRCLGLRYSDSPMLYRCYQGKEASANPPSPSSSPSPSLCRENQSASLTSISQGHPSHVSLAKKTQKSHSRRAAGYRLKFTHLKQIMTSREIRKPVGR